MQIPTTIVLPGKGPYNIDAAAVNRAISSHDERLRFGWNAENEDWVIYIKMPRNFEAAYFIDGEPVYPILGFGRSIPTPEEALFRLSKADTRQRGNNILAKMNKANEALKAQANSVAEAQAEEAAEHLEFEARKAGLTEKYTKVVMGG